MFLKNIKLQNFRNYDLLNLEFDSKINIIYGKNGQGKTNLLESIYFLGLTKSHRVNEENSLIRKGKTTSRICGKLYRDEFYRNLEINISDKTKKVIVDGDCLKKIGEYLNHLNVIIFFPEDLEILKGSPSVRRKFINTELSELQNNYYIVLNEYTKLLKMRNEYLKNEVYDNNYFNILTSYFIDKALLVYKMRKKFILRINEYIGNIYSDIMNINNFYVKYVINDFKEEEITKELMLELYDKVKYEEKMLRKTLFGPHKDDIEFYLNDENMKFYASQGQQRAAVIAFKLAEIELYKKYRNDTPILLLDDVFSELDENKRNNLLKYIDKDIQTIITTTDLNYIDEKILNKAKLIEIDDGKVVKQEEVK